MDFIRKAADTVLRVTPAEAAVRDATNTEKWGPTSTQMHEIAAMTHNYHDYPIVMTTLFKRFQETGRNWRCVYKALLLLEHLIKNGAENCIREAQSRTYELNSLTHFSYIDEDGKDCGLNVRERTKRILELLNDRAAIEDERRKAYENRSKYVGQEGGGYGFGGSYDRNYGNSGFRNSSYDRGFDDFERREREAREREAREREEREREEREREEKRKREEQQRREREEAERKAKEAQKLDIFGDLTSTPAQPQQDFFAQQNANTNPQQDLFSLLNSQPAIQPQPQSSLQPDLFSQPQSQPSVQVDLFASQPSSNPSSAFNFVSQPSQSNTDFGNFEEAKPVVNDPWKNAMNNLDLSAKSESKTAVDKTPLAMKASVQTSTSVNRMGMSSNNMGMNNNNMGMNMGMNRNMSNMNMGMGMGMNNNMNMGMGMNMGMNNNMNMGMGMNNNNMNMGMGMNNMNMGMGMNNMNMGMGMNYGMNSNYMTGHGFKK